MKEFNFTQPFAMRCDAEQFESVKNELEGMGYVCEDIIKHGDLHIITNYRGNNKDIAIMSINFANLQANPRIVIETFNRTLLLALAAMTDKPDGIIGEWFKGCNGVLVQKKLDNDLCTIAVKATADELIKHFSENIAIAFGSISKSNPAETETQRMQNQIAELAERLQNKISDLDARINDQQNTIENLEYSIGLLIRNTGKIIEQPEPKQELRDKQEVWAWDDEMGNTMRIAAFYDSSRGTIFKADGTRGEYGFYSYYEPIPASQIPQWMKEAKLELED